MLKIVYIIVNLIYGSIGTLGSLSLIGRDFNPNKTPENIFDFFNNDPGSITALFLGLVILTHIVTTYPLFNYVSKF